MLRIPNAATGLRAFSRKLTLYVRLDSATLDDEDDQGEDEQDEDGGGADEQLLEEGDVLRHLLHGSLEVVPARLDHVKKLPDSCVSW